MLESQRLCRHRFWPNFQLHWPIGKASRARQRWPK